MSKRISKSAIDWAKVSALFSRNEQSEFLKLKAKCEASVRKVVANPEKPPAIDFNAIKAKVADKSAVDSLEKAYKALSIGYPSDNNVGQLINAEEKDHKERGQKLVGKIREETKEAKELLQKFEDMIPYDKMHPEEFTLTFPEWSDSPQNPCLHLDYERKPGLTRKEYYEISKNLK